MASDPSAGSGCEVDALDAAQIDPEADEFRKD